MHDQADIRSNAKLLTDPPKIRQPFTVYRKSCNLYMLEQVTFKYFYFEDQEVAEIVRIGRTLSGRSAQGSFRNSIRFRNHMQVRRDDPQWMPTWTRRPQKSPWSPTTILPSCNGPRKHCSMRKKSEHEPSVQYCELCKVSQLSLESI